MRFKMKQSQQGLWYFVIEAAGNYETLATSEMYESRRACQHAIELIRTGAASATVTEEVAAGAR
jgi:uncharacterized protein YegP (UPF0339 family)